MQQVFLDGTGRIEIIDTPAPSRIPDSVLVRNAFSLISAGTEGSAVTRRGGWLGVLEKTRSSSDRVQQVWEMARQQGVQNTWEAVKNKLDDLSPVGYSCSGQIVEVDHDRLPYQVGQNVACIGAGFANHAEYVCVPKNLLVPIPEGVAMDQAAFGAIACIAMQGIRRLELSPGERVGVIGLGLIGQVCARLLVAFGYRVYGIDLEARRVQQAGQVDGITAWTSTSCDSGSRVRQETSGMGLDAVVLCAATQSDQPVNLAFDLCRQKGRVSIVGDVGMSLDRKKMYSKEIDLRMSCSYGPGRYDNQYELEGHDYPVGQVRWTERRNLECFLDLLQSGRLDLAPLITDRVAVKDARSAYARIKDASANTYGMMLSYPAAVDATTSPERLLRTVPATLPANPPSEDRVRIGVIGVGGYVKGVHLPNLQRLSNEYSITGLASRSGAAAATAGRKYGVGMVTSDYRRLLDQPDIDAVLVATRHASHAQIVLDALEAGKHVFVEKPLATTVEDCLAIESSAYGKGLVVRVGFNRRFAPALVAMRKAIGSKGARMLTCRVNVGDIGSHWSNTAEEGGRLLGEGVHFFDLCNWFIGEEPTSISAVLAGRREVTNPNTIVQFSYPGGSTAQITYTTMGNTGMGKEYFEAFGNGRSAICNDYRDLQVFGATARLPRRARGDKGQLRTLEEFAVEIRQRQSNPSGADARAGRLATHMALAAFESTKGGTSISLAPVRQAAA